MGAELDVESVGKTCLMFSSSLNVWEGVTRWTQKELHSCSQVVRVKRERFIILTSIYRDSGQWLEIGEWGWHLFDITG